MKWIVKVERTGSAFRINIPRKVVEARCWKNVRYLVIDDNNDQYLVVERLKDDKYEKAGD